MPVRDVCMGTFITDELSIVPPHSKLHFVATTLPWGESGETLFNQLFRAIATRDWLFKYGAMPFSAVMPYSFWKVCPSPQ